MPTEPPSSLFLAERQAIIAASGIIALRMLGLFMLLPVFALLGQTLEGATPLLIGLAIGGYGLMQAILQIPFGWLSDRWGRKPVILSGLVLFAVGGVVAALSDHIWGVILGRLIQGSGAIAGVVMASVADSTRDSVRTRAMATVGMGVGLAFGVAVVLGPWVAAKAGLHGLFWATSVMAVFAMLICWWMPTGLPYRGHSAVLLRQLAVNPALWRINASIFALHLMMTAAFVVIPLALLPLSSLPQQNLGLLYGGVLLLSFMLMLPLMLLAEIKRKVKPVLLSAIVSLILGGLVMAWQLDNFWGLMTGLLLFFWGFNLLEALLPSLVTKFAPVGAKGRSSGLFASSQFLGAFCGGLMGGWVYGDWGVAAVFMVMAAVALLSLLAAAGLPPPRHVTERVWPLPKGIDVDALLVRVQRLAGVDEAVVMPAQSLLCMKVDVRNFQESQLVALLPRGC